MNNQTQEALHKALKVLNCLNNNRVYEAAWVKGAINACEEALESQEIGDAEIRQMLKDIEYYQKRVEELEQPAQEPVAYADYERGTCYLIGTPIPKDEIANPLYTHPAQPLSDDDIDKLLSKFVECLGTSHGIQENGIPEDSAVKFIRAIEQAHGIGVKE